MEDFATKVFTLDKNDSDNSDFSAVYPTQNVMNSQQVHLATTPAVIASEQKHSKGSKKLSHINPYYSYFPDFYIKELKKSLVTTFIWGFVLMITTAFCAWLAAEIIMANNVSNWTMLCLIPIMGLVISLFIVYFTRYFNFKTEAKTINFKDEKVISNNVVKVYKSLKIGYININWMSLLSYCIFLIALLIDCIVCYCYYPIGFGNVYAPISETGNYTYAVIFWLCVSAVLITFILQCFLIISSYVRYSRIENFYNFKIVSDEELALLKKKNNRRDLFIFLGIVLTLVLIVMLVVKLFKRNKKTKVVVNA